MKYFYLLVLLFTLTNQAHAMDMNLSMECPLLQANQDPLVQMQSPRVWSFCTKPQISSFRQMLSFRVTLEMKGKTVEEAQYPASYKRILTAMESAKQVSHDGLVSVSSEYLDIGTKKFKRVSGVGSLIATKRSEPLSRVSGQDLLDSRYFVLTAGHVSMGTSLEIKNANGPLPIKGIYHDTKSDMSLIEIDVVRMHYLPIPLGYYLKSPENPYADGYVLSFLYTPDESSRSSLKDGYSGFTYKIKYIDGFTGYAATMGGLSSILIPSWLKDPGGKDISSSDYAIARGAVSNLHLRYRFPPGFSGAPLEIAYQHNGLHIYNLAGILTLSTRDAQGNSAQATGPVATANFIEKILKSQHQADLNTRWFLVRGAFIRLQKDLTVFVKSGPIGNGVIIDGFVPQSKVENAEKEIRRQMQSGGITTNEVDRVFKVLRESKVENLKNELLGPNFKLEIQ